VQALAGDMESARLSYVDAQSRAETEHQIASIEGHIKSL